MLVPDCNIKITNTKGEIITFNYCKQIDIERSSKTLTNTCKIVLPRKLKLKDRSLTDVFQRGSKIEVRLSYLGYEERLEFIGFIAHVDLTIPVVLHCEDNMWLLKQVQVNRSWEQVSLNKVLHDIIPADIKYECEDVQLGNFRALKLSVTQVLDVLGNLGLYSYFRGETLCVGFVYPPKWAGDANYEATYDMHINVAEDNLEYRKAEEVALRVEVISMFDNGKMIKYKSGDANGELHVIHANPNTPMEGLKSVAEKALEKMRVTTMKGTITSFGIPYCDHGFIANIIDDEYSERNGKYFIDKVTIRFGVDGFRRIIELGKSAA